MQVLISIDDTDNLESRGTGKLAALLIETIEARGWGTAGPITRHQLYVHPDIAYTSHNSTMCFSLETKENLLDEIVTSAGVFLENECAPGSDPGLCVAPVEKILSVKAIVEYGFRAKEEVLNKQIAYELARRNRIHLSEHGGTGIGVIGALAGIGLRLSGNDGRFRGKITIEQPDTCVSVASVIERTLVNLVQTIEGEILPDQEIILLGETVKPVLLDGRCTLLVFPTEKNQPWEPRWQTCTKTYLKMF